MKSRIVWVLLPILFAGAHVFAQELSDEVLRAGEDIPQQQIDSMIDRLAVPKPAPVEQAQWPCVGHTDIISRFGDPRPNGRIHEGIDIGAPRGTEIVAAWSGVVVYSLFDPLGGWSVKLRHKNGFSTYYAHMNERSKVRPGDVIARAGYLGPVGNTGDARFTVTHLHFGLYAGGGRAINPLPYLKGALGR